MRNHEHAEFTALIIAKYRIKINLLSPEDPEFLVQTIRLLSRKRFGHRMLGTQMAAWLSEYCIATGNDILFLDLAAKVSELVFEQASLAPYELLGAATEMRKQLFWTYQERKQSNFLLIRSSAHLLQAVLTADPTQFLNAEAGLSQGGSMAPMERDHFFEVK